MNRLWILLGLLILLCGHVPQDVIAETSISIDAVHCVPPGGIVQVPIRLETNLPDPEWGGFDLLASFTQHCFPLNVDPGNLVTDCGWEYFTYRSDQPQTIKIVSIADINNGANHPTCFGSQSATLAVVSFAVSADSSLDGSLQQISWLWYDCGDNSLSSKSGDDLILSDHVYEYNGFSFIDITDEYGSFPTPHGAPSSCLTSLQKTATRGIDFYNGGILIGIDMEEPVIDNPTQIVTTCDSGVCGATVEFDVTATDNCSQPSLTITPPSGSLFPAGTTWVICEAVDSAGNQAQRVFPVIVYDEIPPTILCPPDTTIPTDPGAYYAGAYFPIPMVDNCILDSIYVSHAPEEVYSIGTERVFCHAWDLAGNHSECFFDVTVIDTEPPQVICPGDTVLFADSGTCGSAVSFAPTVSDNVPGATVACIPSSGSVFAVGTTDVVVIGSDLHGNTDTCSFQVTVLDTIPPQITAPAQVTVSNEPGACGATVLFAIEVDDNCPGATLSVEPASGSWFECGETVVTCIAEDAVGLADTAMIVVTVMDTEPPVALAPESLVVYCPDHACQGTAQFTIDVTDNCSGATMQSSVPSGSSLPLGETEVVVVASDAVGLQDTAVFTITVRDTIAPIINCPDSVVLMTDSGAYAATAQYSVVVSDNCTLSEQSLDPPVGSTLEPGETVVVVTASDVSDNTTVDSFRVVVQLADEDGDAVPDWADNCPNEPNPGQEDSNTDGLGDACCCLGGRGNFDGDADELVNVIDLTAMVSYLFGGGPGPACPAEADLDPDSDGVINIVDLSSLLAYLFGGGVPLSACP